MKVIFLLVSSAFLITLMLTSRLKDCYDVHVAFALPSRAQDIALAKQMIIFCLFTVFYSIPWGSAKHMVKLIFWGPQT